MKFRSPPAFRAEEVVTIAAIDYLILLIYFVGIAGIGLWAGRKVTKTSDFYLGERQMPWFAVTLAILATETSGVTFIGSPGDAFGFKMVFLQSVIGSIIARYLIAYLLLPAFYNNNVTTTYEYLRIRFGKDTQATAAIFYYVTRALASGVRVLAVAIALTAVTGMSLWLSVLISLAFTLFYAIIGGMRAIIWTDVAQIIVFFGGPLFVLFWIIAHTGGWGEVVRLAGDHLQIFDLNLDIKNQFSLPAVAFLGLFMTFAALGCDYDMTQRMLTCKNKKEGQRALIWTGYIDVVIMGMFLLIGACLFAYYQQFPDPNIPKDSDYIFPYFIINVLPAGLKGLLIAGVFAASMSSISGSLGALSTSFITDIYRNYIRKDATDAHYLLSARVVMVVVAVILFIVTLVLNLFKGNILWLGFKIGSFTYGAMLGVFLLGVTVRRGSDRTNIIAMLTSVAAIVALWLLDTFKIFNIGWTWYIVIGTAWTYILGFVLSPPPMKQVTQQGT